MPDWESWEKPIRGPRPIDLIYPRMPAQFRRLAEMSEAEFTAWKDRYWTRRRDDEDPREPNEVTIAEWDERKGLAPGERFKFAFWPRLGEPPRCSGGDTGRALAGHYMQRIEAVMEAQEWTDSERAYLSRMLKVWTRRAYGQDARFNRIGNRRGREKGSRRPSWP